MKLITAAEANRHFSTLLRTVAEGEQITVTSRGKPVATISPVGKIQPPERRAAKSALLARLNALPVTGTRNWSRSELYDLQ